MKLSKMKSLLSYMGSSMDEGIEYALINWYESFVMAIIFQLAINTGYWKLGVLQFSVWIFWIAKKVGDAVENAP